MLTQQVEYMLLHCNIEFQICGMTHAQPPVNVYYDTSIYMCLHYFSNWLYSNCTTMTHLKSAIVSRHPCTCLEMFTYVTTHLWKS